MSVSTAIGNGSRSIPSEGDSPQAHGGPVERPVVRAGAEVLAVATVARVRLARGPLVAAPGLDLCGEVAPAPLEAGVGENGEDGGLALLEPVNLEDCDQFGHVGKAQRREHLRVWRQEGCKGSVDQFTQARDPAP